MSKSRKRQRKRQQRRGGHAASPPPTARRGTWIDDFVAPQPIIRLELLRILVPLCILGFMSTRLVHADHWIGSAGFSVPDLGGDWRQPLYLPPLPDWAAWSLAAAMVVSGLSMAAGFLTRYASGLFFLCLIWVAFADRLAAFTVTKLGSVLVLALFLSPCGARYGVDAWLRWRRKGDEAPMPTHVTGPTLRFFQLLLVFMYFSSGLCKARNDWLEVPNLLWTHLHGSYQTAVTHAAANYMPTWSWNLLQGITLGFEALAPLWFGLRSTRRWALYWGLLMHGMIGLMFGPVIWFSLLMASLLFACFAPCSWLERGVGLLSPGRPLDPARAR